MTVDKLWAGGDAYERYIGRWSRPVAHEFVRWLGVAPDSRWLDVGSGTGALTATILDIADPVSVHGIDPSEAFVAHARGSVTDARASFATGDAMRLDAGDGQFDAVVSGLVINFVSDIPLALREMRRVARPGGIVGVYVWDYAGEMQLIRRFWDAAIELDPAAVAFDEGPRFPICQPGPLTDALSTAGFADVAVMAIDVPTVFRDFDDYWAPFLEGTGPAPAYAMSLPEGHRDRLRGRLREMLPVERDGFIHLVARAWAAKVRRV